MNCTNVTAHFLYNRNPDCVDGGLILLALVFFCLFAVTCFQLCRAKRPYTRV